jgi:uncharacterized membrane protein
MPQRMGATLFGAFALLALVLSALGIYAVGAQARLKRIGQFGNRVIG